MEGVERGQVRVVMGGVIGDREVVLVEGVEVGVGG